MFIPHRYDASLINGRGRWKGLPFPLTVFNVNPGLTYRFRTTNTGGERGFLVSIDDHTMQLVALDGIEITPFPVDSLIIFPGDSFDFEMATNMSGGQYWMRAVTLRHGKGRDPQPDGIINGVKAIVRYEDVTGDAEPTSRPRDCTSAQPCRVFNCPFGGYPDSENKICLKVSDAHIDVASDDFRTKYGLTEQPAVEHFINWNGIVGSSVNARRFVFPKIPFFFDNQASWGYLKYYKLLYILGVFYSCVFASWTSTTTQYRTQIVFMDSRIHCPLFLFDSLLGR